MADRQKAVWSGKSGSKYTYFVYPLPTNFNSGQTGNYIYTKTVENKYQPVYIGQGDLAERTDPSKHHQGACLKQKAVTHVHVHLHNNEDTRLAEEKDLLAAYPQAYTPNGCNEKEGG